MSMSPPSSRALDEITLSFNLVTIPCRLYSGTDKESGVKRQEFIEVPVLNEDGTPKTKTVISDDGQEAKEVPVVENHVVGRAFWDKDAEEVIAYSDIKRKVLTEYGPVYVEDSEIESLFTLEPKTLKIMNFQPQHLFHQGNYVPKDMIHLEPARVGGSGKNKKDYNAVAVKLLATLYEGMRKEGVVAVGELTTRGVPKPVVLSPDGKLWVVRATNEVREAREFPPVETAEAEVTMMRSLIGTMKSTEVTDLTDKRSELVNNFAAEKAAAGDFGRSEDTFVEAAPAAPTMDLTALLQASLDAAKAS